MNHTQSHGKNPPPGHEILPITDRGNPAPIRQRRGITGRVLHNCDARAFFGQAVSGGFTGMAVSGISAVFPGRKARRRRTCLPFVRNAFPKRAKRSPTLSRSACFALMLAPAYVPTHKYAVSSAMRRLTSGFGMEPGVPASPWKPTKLCPWLFAQPLGFGPGLVVRGLPLVQDLFMEGNILSIIRPEPCICIHRSWAWPAVVNQL